MTRTAAPVASTSRNQPLEDLCADAGLSAAHILLGVPPKLRIDLSAVHLLADAITSSSPHTDETEATAEPHAEDLLTPENAPKCAPWDEPEPPSVAAEGAAAPAAADDEKEQEKGASSSKKQAWSPQEDELLLKLVNQMGPTNWSRIAAHLPTRVGKQCRERWHNHLSPAVKKESFSAEEDRQIMEAVALHGTKWAHIVKLIPGRTDNAIKNRWNSTTRKIVRVQKRCGELPGGLGELDLATLDAAALAKHLLEHGTEMVSPSKPPAKRKLAMCTPESRIAAAKRQHQQPGLVGLDLLCRLAEGPAAACSSPRVMQAALSLGSWS